MYKIISRAINKRLSKVVNWICSRAQKGYNSCRYAQEVLINVCETIAHCKTGNIKGSVLAVDMAKAFDSLDHEFIKSVFRFFGFGEYIIKWLNLLGYNREACIMLGDGNFSKSFSLDTGRAQGDNLSPNIFNFCEQILIFKLELDPRIARIPRDVPTVLPPQLDLAEYSAEDNRQTDINESLADDNTELSLIEENSLLAIKSILENFASFSGLQCNFDKTSILPINPITAQELEWITVAGFSITGKLKLLGAEISADPSELHCNFVPIQEKIIKQINFWSRFKLSLPGRISVAKTFMISQINYLGSIFRPTDDQLITIQEVINNFIRKNLKISDNRMYLPPNKGGIGFFNIKSFLESQRCMWLLRAQKMRIDNWRVDLHTLAPLNNPLLIRASDLDKNRHPILFEICTAYKRFYTAFCKSDSNYKNAIIFKNPIFRDPETNLEIDINFFGPNFYNAHKNLIRT
jgi:hypothetical protein